jgi:2-polyprenyl-3-methyl-5-hydroxy-6-metoxy-1,4-benzoquinol methylase
MTTTKWSDGYSVDKNYINQFYRHLSPSYLNYVCLLNGIEPVALDKPFTYFELGCGQGLTATILAASNPQGHFYANDFMPSHVLAAQKIASAADLNNVTFLENSFADLAAGQVNLPQFDFVTLHGVYTWVSTENRKYIIDFLLRYLKPGGVVYVSYNALPGWTPAMPLQKLMRVISEFNPGADSLAHLNQSKQLIHAMVEAKAEYFEVNLNGLQKTLNALTQEDENYLIHEYMHDDWCALYHADVVKDFSAAKLEFLSPTLDTMGYQFPPNQQTIINSIPDRAWSRTIGDFMLNSKFRRDIFVRGRRSMIKNQQHEWNKKCFIALTIAREKVVFEGVEADDPLWIKDFINLLAEKPRSISELAQLPLFAENTELVATFSSLMFRWRQAANFIKSEFELDAKAALRLNKVIAEYSVFTDDCKFFAAPLIGTGIQASLMERLVYLQLVEKPDELNPTLMAEPVMWALKNHSANDSVNTGTEKSILNQPEVIIEIETILRGSLPMWKQLGVI